MRKNYPEIIVVDDDLGVANSYAEYITENSLIHAVSTNSPDNAVYITKENPIRIAILDQNMPIKKGTELFKELLVNKQPLMGILLTGEAGFHDAKDATELGLSLIHKSDAKDELINKIYELDIKYENEINKIVKNKDPNASLFIEKKEFILFKTHKITTTLIKFEVINDSFINEKCWITLRKIEAGQTKKEVEKIKIENSLAISKINNKMVNYGMSLGSKELSMLTSELQTYLENQLQVSRISRREVEYTSEIDVSFPPNTVKKVISVSYECTQIYREVRVYLKKFCTFCETTNFITFIVYLPTNRLLCRTREFKRKGKSHEIITNTGEHIFQS